MLLLSSALALGFLHGLGADHLMAIAALSVGRPGDPPSAQRTRALGVAVRFAAGHALLLAFGAGALILIGWTLPLAVERGGEMLGGSLLIALGAIGLWGVLSGRVYGHTHPHAHEPVGHWHLHIGARHAHPAPDAHTHLATILGAAFAVSSLRALTMLAPFEEGLAASAPLSVLLGLIAVFGIGILISMSLFGVAFAAVMSSRAIQRMGRAAGGLMAIASIALGVFWLAAA